jgi:hypothetical protein
MGAADAEQRAIIEAQASDLDADEADHLVLPVNCDKRWDVLIGPRIGDQCLLEK